MSRAASRTSLSWPTDSPRTSSRESNSVTVSVRSPSSSRTASRRPTTSRRTVMNSVRYAAAAPLLTGATAADDHSEVSMSIGRNGSNRRSGRGRVMVSSILYSRGGVKLDGSRWTISTADAFSLLGYGRISQLSPVLRGKLRPGGPRAVAGDEVREAAVQPLARTVGGDDLRGNRRQRVHWFRVCPSSGPKAPQEQRVGRHLDHLAGRLHALHTPAARCGRRPGRRPLRHHPAGQLAA